MAAGQFNWQQKGWPRAVCNRAALRDELAAFKAAFAELEKALKKPQDMEVVARALADEAVETSAIEGVNVDESVVMSSICKALGVEYAPKGFTKDARAEGVAQMMLAVREKWNAPLTAKSLTDLHGALSAAKWMRMTKVSKPTATRDLGELVAQGAIVSEGLGGPETRYRLNTALHEPIGGLNEGIKGWLVKLIKRHPGARLPYLKSVVGASMSTVERAIAALVKTGEIEHRGSKKTGGYYVKEIEATPDR